MSIYYRVQFHREKLFLKSIRLKRCKEKLLKVLPDAFSGKEFVRSFQECFPYVWEDIESYCINKKNDYFRRKKKGLRTVPFDSPEEFLLKNIGEKHNYHNTLSEEERQHLREQLIQAGEKRMLERKDKLAQKLIYVQQVCPPYVSKLIQTYFEIRKGDTLDINARYLILLEAGQFRCGKTIEFLYKVNACEKNHDLRHMAYYALQRMGQRPWLARKRKGKKRLSQVKPIDIKKNPTELINLISKHQHLLYQKYDIFLSHSSRDVAELLRLKSILNSQGYTVYIDWVNDREMLNRENQDNNTWNVLYLRMNQSDYMLYVMTENCIQSKSTEREVLYFKNEGKSVYYYQSAEGELELPSYLNGCIAINDINAIKFK